METDKMSTASSVGAERRPLLQALVLERRILFACTVLVGLSTFVWITAVCTEKWVHIYSPNGIYLPTRGEYFMWSDSGVWEICRYVFRPTLVPEAVNASTTPRPIDVTGLTGEYYTNHFRCTRMSSLAGFFFGKVLPCVSTLTRNPRICWNMNSSFRSQVLIYQLYCTNYLAQPIMKNGKPADPAYDIDVANYVRTMISFGIISLFVMAMGCGFSIYTFRNPRYMFKRLAAGIHFISTSCTFVVVQVTMSSLDHMQKNVKYIYPERASHYFHISYFLAWFVVLVNFFAAASFLWYSRKRKGDKAATDELAMADEPTIIGR
ncbi:unnamed protein product [Pieris macdunnoughi]|uniref:Uncharacterized protein n=2 Tax=Pieris macdunnoughi TaxID=345717 RepID=A0A821R1S7_9NEOP|nr:unnamed protein product [Pieris macdunnoughi]